VIVTRRRHRRSSSGRLIVPLLALAALSFALAWPPSQRAIANGPLRPVWSAGSEAGSVLARPLSFAGQQQTIADRNREIRELDARLDQERRAKVDAEARAQTLQQHLSAESDQPAPVVALPRPMPSVAAAPFAAAGPRADQTRRLAATWAAMEPERAAALVQRLPEDHVSRVLGQMDADSAGAILNALPAGAAARISRAIAGLAESPARKP
jgi:flagellar motility protein MotE (MotC chaperone)